MTGVTVKRIIDDDVTAAILVLAVGISVALRVLVSGADGPQSVRGGLAFAACLTALAWGAGLRLSPTGQFSFGIGCLGGLVLVAPALLRADLAGAGHRSMTGFLPWVALASIVAVAEEALLRGALFDVIERIHGDAAAVIVGSLMFAGLHIPLYGWKAVPLDLAVGAWLGTLRVLSGTWHAPALAHVLADAAGWWLR
jgi:membrane protease YdiL (CAAX protease family)